MSALSGDIQIAPSSIFSSVATAETTVGARAKTQDGRIFRYCQAGGTALVQGKLQQASAQIANHQNLAPTASAAIGATQVTVTLGATAATAAQYAGGLLVVTVTPGEGYTYRISSNPAANSGASLTVTIEDPLLVALTTSSRIDLIANEYMGAIINPTTASSRPIGVAVYPIAANQFGWLQTGGPCSALAEGAITVGTALVASTTTAGAVKALTGVVAPIGQAITDISTTEYGAVHLLLDV